MKVIIQRCSKGTVKVNNKTINSIDKGFVILVGIAKDDNETDIDYLVKKIIKLRIFNDEKNIMNKDIIETKGKILSISQFTLQANTKDGNRPSYSNAMNGELAFNLYEKFNSKLNEFVETLPGEFGADMIVNIENDGPVTIIIDSKIR